MPRPQGGAYGVHPVKYMKKNEISLDTIITYQQEHTKVKVVI